MSKKRPSIFIITPTFNAERHIDSFLRSVKSQSYPNVITVIINDGSTDNTEIAIKKSFPKTVILKGDGNLWWSGSTNKGVEYALKNNADYIFTVNVDVKLEKSCIEKLVKLAENMPNTLIGSVICDIKEKNKVWYYGGYYDRRKGDLVHATGSLDDVEDKVNYPDWLTGMGVLVPIATFQKVGMYDAKNFPQYFGDADFSLRSKEAGWTLAVSPKALVYADLASSSLEKWLAHPNPAFFLKLLTSRKSQYNLRMRYLFYKKHWGKGYILALVRLYTFGLFNLYKLWTILFAKRLLGRI
jgi:GT2 family glycosyltransferase